MTPTPTATQAAQAFLGDLFFNGQGMPQDFKQALFWFKLAAGKGNVAAQYNLGLAVELGKGEPRSPTQALSWYKKAAGAGGTYPPCWRSPGFIATARASTKTSPPRRAAESAAKTGDPHAQDELGALYRLGVGVEPDLTRARHGTAKPPTKATRQPRTISA